MMAVTTLSLSFDDYAAQGVLNQSCWLFLLRCVRLESSLFGYLFNAFQALIV
jgi:hypothetical protein